MIGLASREHSLKGFWSHPVRFDGGGRSFLISAFKDNPGRLLSHLRFQH